MSTFFLIVLLIITIAIAISQLGVIIYFVNFLKKNELTEGAVKDAQTKSQAVITQAVTRANETVAQAEKVQLSRVADEGAALEKVAQAVEEKLKAIGDSSEKSLSHASTQAQTTMEKTMKAAESATQQVIAQSEKNLQTMIAKDQALIEEKTEEMVGQSEAMFEKFSSQLNDQIKVQIEKEMEEAKKDVEIYKKEREAAIDEKVIDILEEVLLKTLGKKLSLKDEGEFVFQALEQAKKENAFS